ncbi:metallophosphoesterase family protein [Acetohalobium arabaticum]|uniref:Metallophosphoesterase n=1 Tax=Acetohalobium arabaticum (strain ATCC 49924 / DSM 5501 / Z-7288) TaxID=574087 RepID=D9QR50_ACEAZ|nr:metallophosphoesterase [Acetohalobium arabaticum]ADL12991.1 metallophosphoesterase [Acetohalobium arabaticum DSM 5501]
MKQEIIILILIAILTTVVAVNLMSSTIYRLSAFEVEIETKISADTVTEINFPPVGKLIADTHFIPLSLKIDVLNINPDRLEKLLNNISDKEEFIAGIKVKASEIIQLFILRTLLIAFGGGVVGVIILGSRDWIRLFAGGLVGLILLSVLFTGLYFTYDVDRLSDPNYQGMLSAAPWMISLIEEGLNNIDKLGTEMEVITSNISNLFNEVEALRGLGEVEGGTKVLHVSDIHNNPVALDFIEKAVKSFEVDLIIDSGDISDYGTPVEAKLFERIEKLDLPYVFVPGNHDSPTIVEKMAEFDNVIILDEDTVTVSGLTIAGIGDPAAVTKEIKPPESEMVSIYQQKLEELVTEQPAEPDLLATHNFLIASGFVGRVPVLLHGHDHQFEVKQQQGTTIIDAGTTGAAGIRGLQSKKEIPYTVALLHFSNPQPEVALEAVDIIKIYSRTSGFILERKGIGPQQEQTSSE